MDSVWKEAQHGYWVSAAGQVKSRFGRILTPWRQKRGGYLAVKISNGRQGAKTVCVHTLVLTAFVGPRPNGMEACHRNGDPTDNRIENLYWGTRSDNVKDMLRHGTYAKVRPTNRGSRHHMARLTEADVLDIRRRYVKRTQNSPSNVKRLADEYGVSYYTVWDIVTRRSWAHV